MEFNDAKFKALFRTNNNFRLQRPVADWAKSSGVKQFLFISSAGIYKPADEPPHVEGVRFHPTVTITPTAFRITET